MGRSAARLLLDRMSGGTGPAQRVVVGTRLIVRGSAEIPVPAPLDVRQTAPTVDDEE
jgi:LacI family transcriptional regulator